MFSKSMKIFRLAMPPVLVMALLAGCVSEPEEDRSGEVAAERDMLASDAPVDPSPAAEPTKPTRASDGKPGLAQSELSSWVLTIHASTTTLWPTQQLTLTATANQDVGPTPYYLSIVAYPQLGSSFVLKSCGFGTTCSVTTTEPYSREIDYLALLTDAAGNVSPENNYVGDYISVSWLAAHLTLSASPTTVGLGASTTLTAHTAVDIASSPFYTEIFDITAGTRLGACGTGTSCSVAVSQTVATLHKYRAYFSELSSTLPPSGVQEVTPDWFVAWSSSGYSIGLSGVYEQVTATASIDVGPTPYSIEIFDLTVGTRIAVCGTGTTCGATVQTLPGIYHRIVAFISATSSTLPPDNVQAVSAPIMAGTKPIG